MQCVDFDVLIALTTVEYGKDRSTTVIAELFILLSDHDALTQSFPMYLQSFFRETDINHTPLICDTVVILTHKY
jgi:hypothetical protein